MKDKIAEQDKELETLKLTMKAKDIETKSDGTETAKAAGKFTDTCLSPFKFAFL